MNWHPYETLLQVIDEQTIVITPNRRLSAYLHKSYQQKQLQAQHTVWLTPTILPLLSWLQNLWKQLASDPHSDMPMLLNPLQENYLWEKIIAAQTEHTSLLQLSETAEAAKSAWNLIQQWQVNLNHPSFDQTEDYTTFKCFALKFRNACQKEHWIDGASIVQVILEQIKAHKISIPKKIILVGFTEIAPQIKSLLNACETANATIEFVTLKHEHSLNYQIGLPDQDSELLTLARFAKEQFDRNPLATQGFVIPQLDQIRDHVQQVFTTVFAETDCFNISAGKNLIHYPVIYTAFKILKASKGVLPLETLSYLLNSPFVGDAERERSKRASFDLILRQSSANSINLLQIHDLLSSRCPLFARHLQAFLQLQKSAPNHQSHTAWMQHIMASLTALGWPGERSLNSHEFQVVDSFIRLLEQTSSLDQLNNNVNFNEALQVLQKAASKSVFQPKTPDAPIQVLGLLEALALPFDYLWIAGMDDLSWPEQPKPNPFIPKGLQRELKMPRATALRELHYCEEVTAQFKLSAAEVIFSYAEKKAELELTASPLIKNLPALHLDLSSYESIEEKIFNAKEIEVLLDDKGPNILPDEKIVGGTQIIKYQAMCPFKSFAEWRLYAHAIEHPTPGLRAKERGSLLHKALELFWNTYHDQETLLSLSHEELEQAIVKVIDEALNLSDITKIHSKEYLKLEATRLHKLLWNWVQIEKSRPPFKVLKSEKKVEIKLDQLSFNIRIDRIDEVDPGKKLIIDYKTGKHNDINHWFGDRLDEPQLPLYALIDPIQTVGITYAQIAPGELCFKGVSGYTIDINGVKVISELNKTTAHSWQDQLQQWQKTLANLSRDFYQGIAMVDPKDPVKTCNWCALKPLCRIYEDQGVQHDCNSH